MVEWNGATTMDYSKNSPYNSRKAMDSNYLRVFGVEPSFGDNLSDASVPIQLALDAASVAGGTVYIPAGIYRINTRLEISSNTHLKLDKNCVIRRNSAIDVMLINKSNGTLGGYTASTNITVAGGEFDANSAEFSGDVTNVSFGHSTNIDLFEVKFSNNLSSWHQLEINSSKDVRVVDCFFTNHNNATEYLTEALQLDMATGGGFPWFGPQDNTPCKNILIKGNTFNNMNVSAIGSHTKVTGFKHSNINIINNIINLTADKGYHIKTLNWDEVLVSGNICTGGNRGFVFNGSAASEGQFRTTVTGNQLKDVGRHAIGFDFCTGLVCNDNIITNAGIMAGQTGAGIFIYFSKEAVIKGNYITGGDTSGTQGDITLGASNVLASPAGTSDIVATGNVCGTVAVTADLARAVVSDNIIKIEYKVWGTITDVQKKSNYIAGTWVP